MNVANLTLNKDKGYVALIALTSQPLQPIRHGQPWPRFNEGDGESIRDREEDELR